MDRTVGVGVVGDQASRIETVLESGNSTASMDPQQLWQVAQEELRFQVVRPGYEAWLANAVLVDSDGHTFTVGVPTIFARDWVSERYVPLIRETLSGVLGRDCEVIITVDPEASPPPEPPHVPDPTYAQVSEPEDGANDSRLNPAFTFSTFVVGNSSRFAHAACRAVAEAPGKAYNPLFLYGGVGSRQDPPDARHRPRRPRAHPEREAWRTSPSEKFMNEMIDAIRRRTAPPSSATVPRRRRAAHRRHPVPGRQGPHPGGVLPYLQRAARAQKQIVVSSDRPPKDIPDARGPAAQPFRVAA